MTEIKCFVESCQFHAKEGNICGLKTISVIPIKSDVVRGKHDATNRTRKSAECHSFMGV